MLFVAVFRLGELPLPYHGLQARCSPFSYFFLPRLVSQHREVVSYASLNKLCTGVLFIAFNVDRRILYTNGPPSDLDYADAVNFYKTFYEAPLAIKVCYRSYRNMEELALWISFTGD